MHLNVALQSMGGHTEVTFADGQVVLEWRETSLQERKGLTKLVQDAKANGFETISADDKGMVEAVTDAIPPIFFNRAGKLTLKGDKANVKLIAKGLIEAEIEAGKFVMEFDENNESKIIRTGQFECKDAPQKVVVTGKVAGG